MSSNSKECNGRDYLYDLHESARLRLKDSVDATKHHEYEFTFQVSSLAVIAYELTRPDIEAEAMMKLEQDVSVLILALADNRASAHKEDANEVAAESKEIRGRDYLFKSYYTAQLNRNACFGTPKHAEAKCNFNVLRLAVTAYEMTRPARDLAAREAIKAIAEMAECLGAEKPADPSGSASASSSAKAPEPSGESPASASSSASAPEPSGESPASAPPSPVYIPSAESPSVSATAAPASPVYVPTPCPMAPGAPSRKRRGTANKGMRGAKRRRALEFA